VKSQLCKFSIRQTPRTNPPSLPHTLLFVAQASADAIADGEGGEEEEEVEEEEEEQLSAYRCEVCSFTIYPARGREFKFFPAGFKCPSCGSSKEKFYDLTDPEDPRNQEVRPGREGGEGRENLVHPFLFLHPLLVHALSPSFFL